MANPDIIALTADTWVKVATSVTAGMINKLYNDDDDTTNDPQGFLQTYRVTGQTAPTSETEGVICFENSPNEVIDSSFAIDVYIMALKRDGSVRVDLA